MSDARSNRISALGVALGLAVGVALPGAASAYEWTGAKWPGAGPVQYVVSRSLSAEVSDEAALEAIRLGYEVWNAVSCSYIAWSYQGRTDNETWGAADGANVASWRERNWNDSPTALAIASTIWGLNGALMDADIKFNGVNHTWAHFPAGGPGGRDRRTDIASVGAHEVGHCLGLGHSDVPGSTMWPSTGSGDVSGRALGRDDIAGVCDIYPSGGAIPEPDQPAPPPPIGTAGYGEDCADERCVERLFCVTDGTESYCSRACRSDAACGPGYYCAQLSQGGGACARGENPAASVGAIGDPCGAERGCALELVCVDDQRSQYCTGACEDGTCPRGYFCTALVSGEEICAREEEGAGRRPGQGEPCDSRALCERGLFCLNDPLSVDPRTGALIPYCSRACGDGCPEEYRCVPLQPSGDACQIVPTAGARGMGEACWVNPDQPLARPVCSDDLVCVGSEFNARGEVIEPGTCTRNCNRETCCPGGWGCIELTPVLGQCRAGVPDDAMFACAAAGAGGAGGDGVGGVGPGGAGGGGAGGEPGADGGFGALPRADGGGSGGCTVSGVFGGPGHGPGGVALLVFGAFGLLGSRRWSGRRA